MSIKIEVLFPEFANLFGDLWNAKYLRESIPDCEYIETGYSDTPRFVNEAVDLVFMGAMTESQQETVIRKLNPYKARIEELIDSGTVFLMTCNAGEVFLDRIENEDGSSIEGLGIFPLYAKRDMMHRFHTMTLGEFEGMKIVGFKAQFAHIYGDNSSFPFCTVSRGCGINPQSRLEGMRKGNFFAVSYNGPFLVMNPPFAKYLLAILGVDAPLKYEATAMAAYRARLAEFEDPKVKLED